MRYIISILKAIGHLTILVLFFFEMKWMIETFGVWQSVLKLLEIGFLFLCVLLAVIPQRRDKDENK